MQIIDQQLREERANNEQIRLLSIFYFVFGGLTLFISFVFAIYLIILGAIFTNFNVKEAIQSSGTDLETPINIVATLFIGIIILLIIIGILQIFVGFKLRKKTHRILTIVMGVIALPSFPLGTALGVFTIIVLSRPSVIEMYHKQPELLRQKILHPDGLNL